MLFLIDYDRRQSRLHSMQTYEDSRRDEALRARLELELAYHRTKTDHEVVILDASDEQTIRKTHRRYFADLEELARLPAELLR